MHLTITVNFHDWLEFESLIWFLEITNVKYYATSTFVPHFDLFYKANSLDENIFS